MRSLSRLALGSLALAVVASCSLTRTGVESCTKNADCRAIFGSGSVCAADGICERTAPNPRCGATFPADLLVRPESYPNIAVIGSLMDRSVESQRARENAIRLAVTQVNEQRGIGGRLFGVVFCDVAENAQYDSAKRTEAAVASARFLADTVGVSAIVGPSASTDTEAVFAAIKELDVLEISPSATSPALTAVDVTNPTSTRPGLLWRTAPPDTLQGAAIVRHLRAVFPEVTTVAVVAEKGAYGDGLTTVFKTGFEKDGRSARVFAYENTGQRDAAVLDAGSAGAKVVLFFSSQTADAVAFLNAAKSLSSYASVNLFLTDSAANRDLLTGAASASSLFPRIVGSRPAVPQGSTYELFKTSYSAAFQQDPSAFSFVAHAYDAAWLTFYGAAWSLAREGRVSGTGIARGLRQLSASSAEIPIAPASWTSIADTLGRGGAVDVVGASGSLDYDPVVEETSGLVEIWKIAADGKQLETVTTIDAR